MKSLIAFTLMALMTCPMQAGANSNNGKKVLTSIGSSGFDVRCGGQYLLTEEQKARYGVENDLCATKVLQVLLGYDEANVCSYSGNTASQIFFKNGDACYIFRNGLTLKADKSVTSYPWTVETVGAPMTAKLEKIKPWNLGKFDGRLNGHNVTIDAEKGTIALKDDVRKDVVIRKNAKLFRDPVIAEFKGSGVVRHGISGSTGAILQIGANAEGATPEEIVAYFKKAIKDSGCKWYVCLRQNRVKSSTDLNKAADLLRSSFGINYIDHMAYLVTLQALKDQGITPTTSDEYPDENGVNSNPLTQSQIEHEIPCDMECIAKGQVPSSFWYGAWREDGVKTNNGHFNAQGLECLGKYLYREIKERGLDK